MVDGFLGSATRRFTPAILLSAFQVPAPSVVLKMPPVPLGLRVVAYKVDGAAGAITRALTFSAALGRPVSISVQLAPRLVSTATAPAMTRLPDPGETRLRLYTPVQPRPTNGICVA